MDRTCRVSVWCQTYLVILGFLSFFGRKSQHTWPSKRLGQLCGDWQLCKAISVSLDMKKDTTVLTVHEPWKTALLKKSFCKIYLGINDRNVWQKFDFNYTPDSDHCLDLSLPDVVEKSLIRLWHCLAPHRDSSLLRGRSELLGNLVTCDSLATAVGRL